MPSPCSRSHLAIANFAIIRRFALRSSRTEISSSQNAATSTLQACAPQTAACAARGSTEAWPLMKRFVVALLSLATSIVAQMPSPKHPFTFEDMMKLQRVGAPVPSPDGKWVAFDCVDVDLAANTKTSHLWI